MKVRILQEGRLLLLLVCSLLWHTVLGADYHDVRLARRQDLETATVTVTVFTQFTVTETATVTVTPTRAVVTTTVVSTERTTATQVRTVTTCVGVRGGGGRRRRRRDDGDDGKPAATTSTTTLWQSPDATKTLTITATDLQSALQVTATRVVTEVEVVTAEQTATSSAETLPIPSPDGSDVNKPDPLAVVKEEEVHGVHLAIVLGAVFGSVVGAIALFVAGFLWMKKREEKILELEEVAGSVPLGGGGGGGRVAGLLGSVLGSTRSSHYNTIPDAAMFLAASRQLPPQLPPVDLDPPAFDLHYDSTSQLHIPPPPHPAFAHEYTPDSPVSSIGEGYAQTQTSVLSPAVDRERRLSLAVEP